jgi:hypothetical protein
MFEVHPATLVGGRGAVRLRLAWRVEVGMRVGWRALMDVNMDVVVLQLGHATGVEGRHRRGSHRMAMTS